MNKKIKTLRLEKKRTPYIMLAPAYILIAIFMLYPIINTVILSFQHYSVADKFSGAFAGLDNYIKVFQDKVFLKALGNTFTWTFWCILFQSTLGMVLALILNSKFKGRGICRALAFTPWAIAGITVAMMWSFMMSESVGVINDILVKLNIFETRISWFSSENLSMAAVVIANTWRGIPFFAISFLAALQGIDEAVYESANVDGSGKLRTFFQITLPMIKDTVVLTTLLRTIWTINTVDIIYGMTAGGPNNGTLTVPVYITNTFNGTLNFSYASTMGVVMTVILLVFSIVYMGLSKTGEEELY